ncbi:MAG: family 16 glycosylhydrolase [Bacteroidota bacterium]
MKQSIITNMFKPTALLVCLSLFACNKKTEEDPTPVTPSLSISDTNAAENVAGGKVSFTVTLSAAASGNVVVNYATVDGTAVAGADYKAKTDGNLIFKAGETQKTIDIELINDNGKENTEQFDVLLLNPIGATISKNRGKATITDDDTDNPLIIPTTGYSTPLSYPGKTLVWADEFDGTTLNSAWWTQEIGNGQSGWGNNELQFYRAENTSVQSGNLIIEARKESYSGSEYTSSRIITKDKKAFKYGRIDIRAALPKGQGIWPALWMLGSNLSQVNWPACGEIDIMELVGNLPNRVYGTVHYGASLNEHQQNGLSQALSGTATFNDEYHVFSLVWEKDSIKWYVDDVQYHQVTPADLGTAPYPFNQDFFFIFNLAVGGNWPGSPDASTVFPQRLIVDYVRVFQ